MANRSYLYTCDRIPDDQPFYARGLSEYPWGIPLAHKVMMLNAPRVTASALWNHEIGIVAERAGAFERVIALFEKIGEGELEKREEFDHEVAKMKEFLATTPDTPYVLLETGEILDLYGGPIAEHAQVLCREIVALGPVIERALAGEADDWLAKLRADWEKEARPGWWNKVLFFSFKPVDGMQEEPTPTVEPTEATSTSPSKATSASKSSKSKSSKATSASKSSKSKSSKATSASKSSTSKSSKTTSSRSSKATSSKSRASKSKTPRASASKSTKPTKSSKPSTSASKSKATKSKRKR